MLIKSAMVWKRNNVNIKMIKNYQLKIRIFYYVSDDNIGILFMFYFILNNYNYYLSIDN